MVRLIKNPDINSFYKVIRAEEPNLNREAVRKKARQQLKRYNKVGR